MNHYFLKKMCLLLVCVGLVVSTQAGKWELVSDYEFDGNYNPTPYPGSGSVLQDSGPAGNDLATFSISGFSTWPLQISPGSDGSGNAVFFDSNQRNTLHSQSFDFSEGFRAELDFKDFGSQTNLYPTVINFFDGATVRARLEARPSTVGGRINSFMFFVGTGSCSITGNWQDGNWYSVVIEYDPVNSGKELYLQVGSQTATATVAGAIPGKIANPIMKLGQRHQGSGDADRGYSGGLDNIKVYRRNYEWLQYSLYDFEGSYDASTGTGDALLDKGPVGANHLVGVNGVWSANQAPTQADGADPNTTEDGAFLFKTVSDGSGGHYTDGVQFPFNMDCSTGFKIEYDFKVGSVEADSVYPEIMFGVGAGNYWSIQAYCPEGTNILQQVKLRFGGQDTPVVAGAMPNRFSDNQWRTLTAGYYGSRTWISVNDTKLFKDAVFSVGNPHTIVLGRTQSGLIRYAYQGLLDNVKISYLKQADLIYPTAGDTLFTGQLVEIRWEPLGYSNLAILYSLDNGDSWEIIEGLVQNTGSYYWNVPETAGSEYIIKLASFVNHAQVYSTTGLFSIEQAIPADLNKDGFVNDDDLVLLAEGWLECGNPFGCN